MQKGSLIYCIIANIYTRSYICDNSQIYIIFLENKIKTKNNLTLTDTMRNGRVAEHNIDL